jgi:uncharacterized membrane protein YcaP (DUF421 family)
VYSGVVQMRELIGGAGGLGWVAVKAVLLFAVAVIGLRLGERRTLAQLSAFDFAVAVAIGAIIGRGATASDTSFATSAVALVTFLVAHRVVAISRRHSRVVRLIDHPPRVLVARGELQAQELARAGLTDADVYALLRQNGVGDLGQVRYLLYETRGTVTVIGADREPGPLMRDGLNASGYRPPAQTRRAQQLRRLNASRTSQAVPTPILAGRADRRYQWPGWRGRKKAVQAARRCSSQIVAPSAAAVRATKMPASMNWKGQNRSAGWYRYPDEWAGWPKIQSPMWPVACGT